MGEAAKQTQAGCWVVGTKVDVGCSPQEMTHGQDERLRGHRNPSMYERLLVWADGKEDTSSGH